MLKNVDPLLNAHPNTTPLPTPTSPNATVAFFWDDFTLDGTAPLAVAGPNVALDGFTIMLRLFERSNPGQISQLYITLRVDGCIKVVFQGEVVAALSGSTGVGIENVTGDIGLEYMSSGVPLNGANFRADYAVLFCPLIACQDSDCSTAPQPSRLGNVLSAVRSGNDLDFRWPGAISTDMEAHRIYRDSDVLLPDPTREDAGTVPLGVNRLVDIDAMTLPPQPLAFYQLVGLGCSGMLIGPY